MPTTAHEDHGNLVIDFGDGTTYTIYPVPGAVGLEIQTLLIPLALGATMHGEGPEKAYEDTIRLTKLALGLPPEEPTKKRRKAPNRREQAAAARFSEYSEMRHARQELVAQAATLWNVGGGGIEAVQDLLDEAGGFPKALERVMESSGLGDRYRVLRTWLSSGEDTSETGSTKSPTGGPSTSV